MLIKKIYMAGSSFSRVISGSLASWCNIVLNFAAQIIAVPIFLAEWSSETYGQWLALLSVFFFIQLIDTAHQTFIGNEVLKIGASKIELLKKTLFSGVVVSTSFGLLQAIVLFILFYFTNFDLYLVNKFSFNITFINDVKVLITCYGFMWAIFGSAGGMLVRGLSPFGYYPRMAWWGVYIQLVTLFIPALFVFLGYNFLEVGLALIAVTALVNIHFSFEFYKLYSKIGFKFDSWSFALGLHNFKNSQYIIYKNVLEMSRNQGIRLLLAPLAGATVLASFSTLRTGANVALQGLSTITNPLMPELMRFIHTREQDKVEASIGTVWVVIVCLICPFILLLQIFMEPFFLIWTRNKIEFDPVLFGLLSLGVGVYGMAQPAMAIVMGNNILKPQIFISLLTALIVIVGLFFLLPIMGIMAAGISLLIAEIVSLILYKKTAQKWLFDNGLKWPKFQFNIGIMQLIIVSFSIFLLIYFPTYKYLIVLLSLVLQLYLMRIFWQNLPKIATDKFNVILNKVPFFF